MESTACSAEDMQGSCLSTSPAYHVHREAASTSSSACATAVEPTQLSERFHQLHQRDSIKQEQQLTIRPSPASPIPHAALLQQALREVSYERMSSSLRLQSPSAPSHLSRRLLPTIHPSCRTYDRLAVAPPLSAPRSPSSSRTSSWSGHRRPSSPGAETAARALLSLFCDSDGNQPNPNPLRTRRTAVPDSPPATAPATTTLVESTAPKPTPLSTTVCLPPSLEYEHSSRSMYADMDNHPRLRPRSAQWSYQQSSMHADEYGMQLSTLPRWHRSMIQEQPMAHHPGQVLPGESHMQTPFASSTPLGYGGPRRIPVPSQMSPTMLMRSADTRRAGGRMTRARVKQNARMAPAECRFQCLYPGCEKLYASRDAVRKHCRTCHLNWLLRLDRLAYYQRNVPRPSNFCR